MWGTIGRKKKLLILLVVFVGIFFLIGRFMDTKQEKEIFPSAYIMSEELPELLSFIFYDVEQWKEQLDFKEGKKVNYKKLEEILEYLSIKEYITYQKKLSFQPVLREDFFQIYEQILEILDVENQVERKNLIFLQKQGDGEWITQEGNFTVKERNWALKELQIAQVYCCQRKIIGFRKPYQGRVTWKNAFIHQMKEGTVQIFHENKKFSISVTELEEKMQNTICDIVWQEGKIKAIYKKEDRISGEILSYSEKEIEISGYGSLAYEENWKIYKTYGTLEQVDKTKLTIGNLNVNVVVANGKVCGMILKEPGKYQKIRVLLQKKEQPYHEEVYLVSEEEMSMEIGKRKEIIPKQTLLKISEVFQNPQKGHLKLSPATAEGEIYFSNEKGEKISLGYSGSLEIRKYPQGYGIVNELPIEEYLCAVVPSEMPASYHKEALRAQAVCARSYAYIQLENQKYAAFAANVDDSVNCQVYNQQPQNPATTLAVKDTTGEVLTYKNHIVEAYYYSTSCGFSQDMDVWQLNDKETYGYLQKKSLLMQESNLDLSKEQEFEEFIQQDNLKAYESQEPYFRWQAKVDMQKNLWKMNEIIVERQNVNKENIKILDEKGNLVKKNPKELGELKAFCPKERSVGGVLKSLELEYEKGSILVKTEYNIRRVLSALVTELTDNYGKEIASGSLLPSAAFAVVSQEGEQILYGGGYGHGIGMSQNGANGMAKEGLSYLEILQKCYDKVTIQNVEQM